MAVTDDAGVAAGVGDGAYSGALEGRFEPTDGVRAHDVPLGRLPIAAPAPAAEGSALSTNITAFATTVAAADAAHSASFPLPGLVHRDRRWSPHEVGAAYGALDLGTNNCRLLIARPAEPHFRVVDAFSRIVRLGEGLGAAGKLGDEAIERAIEALKICRAKMDLRGVSRSRLIATEACRAADNGQEFIARVERETGLSLEVVDRRTEAFLAVSGCASLAAPEARAVLIFDIGGGSTEVACVTGPDIGSLADPCERIEDWVSLPVGVVNLAERHGGYDVSAAIYERMVEEVMDMLAPFRAHVGWASARHGFHLLGTSGTVTTIAGVHLRLPRYDRRRVDGLWMSDGQVGRVVRQLRRASYRDRAANACIGRDRADLVLAGCAILDGLRRSFPSPRLRIADRGLREGILMSLMREDGVWKQGSPS